eukprot:228516-Chlamydomonas_euryale.AAC.1
MLPTAQSLEGSIKSSDAAATAPTAGSPSGAFASALLFGGAATALPSPRGSSDREASVSGGGSNSGGGGGGRRDDPRLAAAAASAGALRGSVSSRPEK